MAAIDYPPNCLRGIPNERQVLEEGFVDTNVFLFTDANRRASGEFESSINWEDDKDAIPFTLAQQKEGAPQFGGGIAVVPRADLDALSTKPAFRGALSYDRQRQADNPYHGNLVLAADTSKPKRKAIAAALAMHVSRIVTR